MRLTQIQNMLKNHEERIKELEGKVFLISTKENIKPINTKEGQEQRDKARDKILKAEEEKK